LGTRHRTLSGLQNRACWVKGEKILATARLWPLFHRSEGFVGLFFGFCLRLGLGGSHHVVGEEREFFSLDHHACEIE